jgi:DNA-binding PadR family transcriptional regulator
MTEPKPPEAFLPLSPLSTAVLLALAGEDLHGYAIIKEVESQSAGRMVPGAGSLYAALQRMVADGLLREVESPGEPEVDRRRRYYGLTELGREALDAELRRLDRLLSLAAERRPAAALRAAAPREETP